MVEISPSAKISQVEDEDNGGVIVVGEGAAVLPTRECPVEEDEILVVVDVDLVGLIHWRVIGAQYMAIWPVTIPAPQHSH